MMCFKLTLNASYFLLCRPTAAVKNRHFISMCWIKWSYLWSHNNRWFRPFLSALPKQFYETASPFLISHESIVYIIGYSYESECLFSKCLWNIQCWFFVVAVVVCLKFHSSCVHYSFSNHNCVQHSLLFFFSPILLFAISMSTRRMLPGLNKSKILKAKNVTYQTK